MIKFIKNNTKIYKMNILTLKECLMDPKTLRASCQIRQMRNMLYFKK
jgi:hypothetical protein